MLNAEYSTTAKDHIMDEWKIEKPFNSEFLKEYIKKNEEHYWLARFNNKLRNKYIVGKFGVK